MSCKICGLDGPTKCTEQANCLNISLSAELSAKRVRNKKSVYVLTLSKNFMATHPKHGTPTGFYKKFMDGKKIHTIRANYSLWKQRIDKVKAGYAIISIREWSGEPYRSKQNKIVDIENGSGIGIQKLERCVGWIIDNSLSADIKTETLAKNDGLSKKDFTDWFKLKPGLVITEDKAYAIIHFTDFRYNEKINT